MAVPKTKWKKDQVVCVAVKNGVSVLAQMLDTPDLAFFSHFSTTDRFDVKQLRESELLFCCAVTRQFLKHSLLNSALTSPLQNLSVPRLRIGRHLGTREITVWEGTQHERRFYSLESRSGGCLLDRDPQAPASEGIGKKLRELQPSDFDSIAKVEVDVVWTFPLLNERLHLIHQLGKPVDPLKELLFDQRMISEYRIFVDMLASHGSLTEWGFEDPR